MFLQTKRKIYELKFGLKGLILMRENTDLVAEKNKRFILYCGLICQHPDITFQEIDEIIEDCDLSALEADSYTFLSLYEVEELYIKAIGEIGIIPSDFYNMTPEEIDWAYEGYLRKQETTANLTKLAIIETLSDNHSLIRLTEDKGYTIGTENERDETFKKLGIE